MKVAVLTLGCKVNKYESDSLVFELKQRGFEATEKLEKADCYVINTCAVTNEAESKSRQMIERARKLNENAHVFVVGCASQNRPVQFEGKGVDYVLGTAQKKRILLKIEQLEKKQNSKVENSQTENSQGQGSLGQGSLGQGSLGQGSLGQSSQVQESPSSDDFALPEEYEDDLFSAQTLTRAFIKIQDGCNNFCTYCIIPYIRGRSRSRRVESVVAEVEKLPEDVKEVVLVGIDLSDFQIDGKKGLGTLLQKLDKFGKRIRLSSLEDNLIDEEFLKTLASLKNFCPHFHLSLQSGSDDVLKKMNRKYTTADFERSVELIRKHFPNAAITTDVIVGFPTETEENFNETLRFVKKIKFSQLHVFPYSKRDGTAAAKIYKDLSGKVKSARAKKLIEVGKKLQAEFVSQNKTGNVLIEEIVNGFGLGYTENYIKCRVKGNFKIGEILAVKLKSFENGVAECEILKS